MQTGFVSVIAPHLRDPIASLVESLIRLPPKEPTSQIPTGIENGYSMSIIVLAVIMVESVIGRIQYLEDKEFEKFALVFIRTTYPEFADQIEELFVVRDAIVHNHIWEAWSENYHSRIVSADLRDGYGDPKFRNVIDLETRTTKLLHLNLFPTSVCRTDAKVVLKTAIEFLLFLEGKDRRYINLSTLDVMFQDELTTFSKLVDVPWGDT